MEVANRPVRYRPCDVEVPDGSAETGHVPREKGFDLRLGLDVARLACSGRLDVAVIFSQDQDLAEVVRGIRGIVRGVGGRIKVGSGFPAGPAATAKRGMDGAEWIRMERPFHDACLDERDHCPKSRRRPAP